ncbi:Doubled CXXCH motif [Rubripirellula reticaptiva]|uniref:Doubled CXXCH motif n=1 Tax=Rubripirellula reticaptiva TaxID=2528013 RepID=A0A5C6F7R6_9BACT|nr:Doubled CXXCH motif [Rubripirellula reticaptiva]
MLVRKKHLLIVALTICVIGWFLYAESRVDDSASDVARLRKLKRSRPTESEIATANFDALAEAGKGQPVPAGLINHRDPSGFWFVGKNGQDVGVEVPFAPGTIPKPPKSVPPIHENPGFVGAVACGKCHPETFKTFSQTAHHRTSSPATAETLNGPFTPPENVMQTSNYDVNFTMLKRGDRFYQRVSFFDWKFEVPFDIIFGSSKMAQTCLYWNDDQLFQMNVTYLTEIDGWINSPGFIDGDAAYARPIGAVCMDCHTTYADFRSDPNHFTPGSIVYGVSCERCHGPGRQHIEYHEQNPNVKGGKHLIVPSDLPRDRELEICAQCHSGTRNLLEGAYQFRPGDLTSDHYSPAAGDSKNHVHTSNQLARLSISKCFTESEMTCADCHDPHQFERGNKTLFSQRCSKCHNDLDETVHASIASKVSPQQIADNCVDCHMPSKAGDHLKMDRGGEMIFPPLRDHHVRIDLEAAAEFIRQISPIQ